MKKNLPVLLLGAAILCPLSATAINCDMDCGNEYGCETVSGQNYIGCGYYELHDTRCMCVVKNYDSYECVSGYYGASGSRAPTCYSCPDSGRSSQGTQSITGCYVRAGDTLTDTTGTYSFTVNCYYSG